MGIEMDKPSREMSLSALSDYCVSEIGKYSRGEPHDDQYCLEIFHRAMVDGNEHAWEILHQRFSSVMLNWVRRHPNREAAYRCDDEKSYVDRAFRRLWMRTKHNQVLEFNTLAGALHFLRMCLNSDIVDTLRAQLRPEETSLPESGFSEEPTSSEPDNGHELWEAIKSLLSNEREQRLAYLVYYCGLKPRQIVQLCPDEFSNVHEIFSLKRNIVDRLKRNKDRLRWLLGDDEF
ncbi:MAG: hypothetical protein NVS4B7_10770 [Ktedonobacteraceae bacterium]